MNQSRSLVSVPVFIIFILLLIGLVWGNYHFAENNIAGEGFSIQWISIRSLITDGNSPYSDLVTARIQEFVNEENSFVPGNPPKYTSPLYSGIVVFPFTLIGDINIAHAFWLSVQLVAIFMLLVLSIKITVWKPAWYIFLLFSLFTIFSYHVVMPWLDGGLAIWASLFLILAFLAIYNNRNEVGGVLLAMTTIQPQMVVLTLVFTLIWAASKRKKILILWFFITVIFLSIVGLFLVPNWIIQYIRLLYGFQENFPPGTPGVFFSNLFPGLGKQLGWVISGVSSLLLILEWWLALRKDFRWFLWTACLTMVFSQWIGIPTIPGNFIGLLLPLILISAMLTERWPREGQWVAISMLLILFIWEWALFYIDLTSTQPKMQLNLIFPLPLVLLIGLYWVRWWAVKPRRLLIEELRLSETN
ncbi:MAG: hypothetical protein WAM09_11745 [Anaerolineales bacterium]